MRNVTLRNGIMHFKEFIKAPFVITYELDSQITIILIIPLTTLK